MMHEEFTPAVERALIECRRIAGSRQRPEAALIDLLHALLLEEEGRAFLLLIEHGADTHRLRNWIVTPDDDEETDGALPVLSEAAQQAIQSARRTAREVTVDRQMNSEHLLFAVLEADDGLLRELETLGTDCGELNAKLTAVIQGPAFVLDEPLNLHDSTQQFDVARILDANANRAGEALRVIEDYCRYVLDDSFLCKELKACRHDLASAMQSVGGVELIDSRDTLGDVGTDVSTASEQVRYSPADVIRANSKRLQEALRSLEEFTKIGHPEAAKTLEQLRYRSYTLDKAIVTGDSSRKRLLDVRLCLLVSIKSCLGSLEWTVKEAMAGGAQMIQLREKNVPDRELWQIAKRMRKWTHEAGTLFLMNDRPDIARLADADGVQLGQDDLSAKEARRILAAGALIGVSTHNLEQAYQAIQAGAAYIGAGPTFPSLTKEFEELAGLQFIREVNEATSIPSFAIGGITLANLPKVLEAGAWRVAVSHSICMSEEPQAVARAMRQLLDSV